MSNEEFETLVSLANILKNDLTLASDTWQTSPFDWARKLSPATKGKLGKRLIKSWCGVKDLGTGFPEDSDADILINGHRAEIKLSFLWDNGTYVFQQIREQNYELLIALGISPHDAHCWVIDKSILRKFVIGKMPQHMGKRGKDTDWLSVNPSNPPDWLRGCGGSLDQAFQILQKLRRI